MAKLSKTTQTRTKVRILSVFETSFAKGYEVQEFEEIEKRRFQRKKPLENRITNGKVIEDDAKTNESEHFKRLWDVFRRRLWSQEFEIEKRRFQRKKPLENRITNGKVIEDDANTNESEHFKRLWDIFPPKGYEVKNSRSKSDGSRERNRLKIGSQMAKLSKTTRTRTKVSILSVFETFSVEDYEVKNSRSKSDGSRERNRLKIGSQMAKLSKTTRTRTKVSILSVFETFSVEDYEVKNSRSKSDGSRERNRLKIGSQMAKLSKTTRTRTKVSILSVFETFSVEDYEVKNSRSKSDGSRERNRLKIGSQMAKLSKTTRTRTKVSILSVFETFSVEDYEVKNSRSKSDGSRERNRLKIGSQMAKLSKTTRTRTKVSILSVFETFSVEDYEVKNSRSKSDGSRERNRLKIG